MEKSLYDSYIDIVDFINKQIAKMQLFYRINVIATKL